MGEARMTIISLKQIGGEIARWACRQSPYGMPAVGDEAAPVA